MKDYSKWKCVFAGPNKFFSLYHGNLTGQPTTNIHVEFTGGHCVELDVQVVCGSVLNPHRGSEPSEMYDSVISCNFLLSDDGGIFILCHGRQTNKQNYIKNSVGNTVNDY